VGRRVKFTPGEVQRFYDEHKQDYVRPESVQLSEILVSTGDDPDDAAKTAAGKAKADGLEAKLHAGGDFSQLAKSFSDGTTAADGGSFGTFKRGELAQVFEDAVFGLKPGGFTDPIRTKQGYVIFKVEAHNPGGVPAFKDVEQDVEQNYYESRMMPAMRDYLTEMREEAYIDIKPGYTDSGASPKEIKPVYSAYTPPATKKKKKVERTRFRETTHAFRQKSPPVAAVADTNTASAKAAPATKKNASATVQKPGKKEKIRYGQAPTKTLPGAQSTAVEDAGATEPPVNQTASAAAEPDNPLEAAAKPAAKTRFSARAKTEKIPKATGPQPDKLAAPPPDAAEVADKQQQAAPLGLSGDTSKSKKKKTAAATTGEKTRLTDDKKKPADATPDSTTAPAPPAAPVPPPAAPPAPQQ